MPEAAKENWALIAFISDPIKAERNLQKLISQAKDFCRPVQISSVYKRNYIFGSDAGEQNPELVMASKVVTTLSLRELFNKVTGIRVIEGATTSCAILLSMNQEILMTPGSTLPDPRLMQDRLILQCAAEVWGDYEHPILGKSLTELVKLYPVIDPIEFFSQGTYL